MLKCTRILLLGALALAIGCSDIGEPLQPQCDLLASTLDFGQVAPGETANGNVTIRNPGPVEVMGDVSLSGTGFALASGGGPFVLEPLAQMTVTITFAPSTAGTYNGVLSAGGVCGNASLTGTSVDTTPSAACDVRPGSIDFGDVELGSSMEQSFTILNAGVVQFSGSVSALCTDYTIVSGGGSYTLLPGDSVNVAVRFSPSKTGTIDCTISTGVDCSQVPVTGSGIPAAPTTSYGNDIQPIFTTSCAVTGCHVTRSPSGGLDLSAGQSYTNLVGVTSFGYAPALRVAPGDPSASVLYNKVTNTGMFGAAMPAGSNGLNSTQANLIRSWILEGAPNN
jgi:hypothetical protein